MSVLDHLKSAYNNYVKPTVVNDATVLTKGFNRVSPVDLPIWYQHPVNPNTDPMNMYFKQQLALPKLVAPLPYTPPSQVVNTGRAMYAPRPLQVVPEYRNPYSQTIQSDNPYLQGSLPIYLRGSDLADGA